MAEVSGVPDPNCPRCHQSDCVSILPKRNMRRDRKQKRSGRTARMDAITGKPTMLECSRCAFAWHVWSDPPRAKP